MLWVTSTIVVAVRAPEPQQLEVEPLAGQGVERAERLVEQQHPRLEGEGPGDRRPLAHPARQLDGSGIGHGGLEPDELEQLGEALASRRSPTSRRAPAGR